MAKGKKALPILTGVVLLSTFVALMGYAAVPQQISYQGLLKDASGNPVPDGDYTMGFSIYDDTNTLKWTEAQTVPVSNGVFNVQIGQDPIGNPFPSDLFDGDRYLGITVGTDPEMTPRQKLTSVAFAIRAQSAGSDGGQVPLGTILDWYRFDDEPLPDGFALCDGSTIQDPASPFFGNTLPDLVDRFVLGVSVDRVGETGGVASHNHAHPFSVDTGESALPTGYANLESVEITGGGHDHPWITVGSGGAEQSPTGDGYAVGSSMHSHSFHTHGDMGHGHGTHGHRVSGSTSSVSLDNHPPYFGLLKIMRIR